MDIPKHDRLISLPQVEGMAGIARSRIYELESQGLFPRRIVLSARKTVWSEDEVALWVETRKQERVDPKAAAARAAKERALRAAREAKRITA
jgi:predicted DNA-binding transcriptional regulator AlpA